MKPKVAVDVDGVLADVYTPIFQMIGRPYTWKDVRKWDFFDDLGIDRQQFWETYKKIWGQEYNLIPLIEEDASRIIAELRRCFEVHIMSCRPKETFSGTLMWLQYRRIEYDGLILLPPLTDKTKYLDNYLALVDDNPAFAQHSKVVIFDRPWNRHVEAKRRIRSLRELLEIVELLDTPPQRGV
jgi:5'(3')-deoxyribonucleotidase